MNYSRIFAALFVALCLVASAVDAAERPGVSRLDKRAPFRGDVTWYQPGMGACGRFNNANQYVVAMNAPQFGNHANPNKAPICGRKIRITCGKRKVVCTVVDKCPECIHGAVDISPAAFKKLASLGVGRMKCSWTFVDFPDRASGSTGAGREA